MEEKKTKNIERELSRIQTSHQELIERIGQAMGETVIPDPKRRFYRVFSSTAPIRPPKRVMGSPTPLFA